MAFCKKCGGQLNDLAKFCNKCGTPHEIKMVEVSDSSSIDQYAGYYNWTISPNEVCRKIALTEIQGHENAKGMYVTPGTQAVFFLDNDGKLCTALKEGKYDFSKTELSEEEEGQLQKIKTQIKRDKPELSIDEQKELGFLEKVSRGLKRLASIFSGSDNSKVIEKSNPEKKKVNEEKLKKILKAKVSTIHVYLFNERMMNVELLFNKIEFKDLTADVGVKFSLKVLDPALFLAEFLVDSNNGIYVSKISQELERVINNVIKMEARSVEVSNYHELFESNGLNKIIDQIANHYSSISLDLLDHTVAHEGIAELRKKREESVLQQKTLDNLVFQQAVHNLSVGINNEQELKEALVAFEHDRNTWSTEKEKLQFEQDKKAFFELLAKEDLLRQAKTEDELKTAKAELLKSGMLREDEIEQLSAKLKRERETGEIEFNHSATLISERNRQEIKLMEQNLEIQLKKQNLSAESDMIDTELDLKRKREDASRDSKRKDQDLDHDEILKQMELAEKAAQLTKDKRKQEHDQKLEEQQSKADVELEKIKMYTGMTVEQIMVTNPDLTAQAALAITEKFKAEAKANENDTRAEDAKKQSEEMRGFMERQQDSMVDIVRSVTGAKQTPDNTPEEPKKEETSVFCGDCGNKNATTMKFCGGCGSKL